MYHIVAVILSLSLLACAEAFISPGARLCPISRTELSLMSPWETEKLIKKAQSYLDGPCSPEQVEDLVSVLQHQQKELHERVTQVRSMVTELERINSKRNREVNQIKDLVSALFQVFRTGMGQPYLGQPEIPRHVGWSGEIGDGPTTAYDALSPKPYKPKS